MNIFKAYANGIKLVWKSKKMISFLYFFTLVVGLSIAIPFFLTLKSTMGFSMSIYNLLKGFDYTSYKDFMHNYGATLKPFATIALWISVLYLIFSIFLAGGIIHIIYNEKKFSLNEFFSACGEYFLSFLRLALIVIPIQILLVVIVFVPLSAILKNLSRTAETEAILVYTVFIGVAVYIMLAGIVLLIADYAKILMVVNESKKAVVSFLHSIKFFFAKFFGVLGLYILLLIFPFLIIVAYNLFSYNYTITSKLTFLIIVLVQQIFIWLRILVKVWFLGSETVYLTGSLGIEKTVTTEEEWDIEELTVDN